MTSIYRHSTWTQIFNLFHFLIMYHGDLIPQYTSLIYTDSTLDYIFIVSVKRDLPFKLFLDPLTQFISL